MYLYAKMKLLEKRMERLGKDIDKRIAETEKYVTEKEQKDD